MKSHWCLQAITVQIFKKTLCGNEYVRGRLKVAHTDDLSRMWINGNRQ